MSFSFSPALSDDLSIVRRYIGDIDADGFYLEDATITALIASEGGNKEAALECVEFIITQLQQPNFKKDWLSVTNDKAAEGWERTLSRLRKKWGLPVTTSRSTVQTVSVFRSDSYQSDGDYDGAP